MKKIPLRLSFNKYIDKRNNVFYGIYKGYSIKSQNQQLDNQTIINEDQEGFANINNRYKFALDLFQGKGMKENKREAFKIFHSLANTYQHSKSYQMIGKCQIMGDCCDKDIESGLSNLKKSSEMGDDTANILLGDYYLSANDDYSAKIYFMKSYLNGNLLSSLRLAKIFLNSEKDDILFKSIDMLYELASILNPNTRADAKVISSAQLKLWQLRIENKRLIEHKQLTEEKLLEFLQFSAQHGNVVSQYELGMYFHQHNKKEEAIQWLETSSKEDYIPAMYNLGLIYLEDGNSEGLEFLHLCAKNKHVPSKLKLIEVYSDGPFKDEERSQEVLLMSAYEGIPEAEYLLGLYHFNLTAFEEAYKWFLLASKKDHLQSIFNIGMFHLNGVCVPKDEEKGWSFIREAASKGDPDSLKFIQDQSYNF